MEEVNNRKDILLLLLYSPGLADETNEPVVGRTRLVKMLYLFKQEAMKHFRDGTDINEDNFYEFYPWDFGPFSAQVYDDITFFILQGFIESSISKEESLPESEAEWAEWQSAVGADDTDDTIEEFREEEFRLTDKGERFSLLLYETLSKAQKMHLREFKKRTTEAPLRALLRYIYKTYKDDTVMSKIRDEILSSERY